MPYYIRQMNAEKKLKLMLASLRDPEILKFLDLLTDHFPNQFKKTIRQLSFNCFEAVCEFQNKIVSGYGKNSHESYVNSVRTLAELLSDDATFHDFIREGLRTLHKNCISGTDSQKKLSNLQKDPNGSMKNVGIWGGKHPSKLKQEIFECLNLDNLKISNPNVTYKTKGHQKYMSQAKNNNETQSPSLQQMLQKNKELQQKLAMAKKQNNILKQQIQRITQPTTPSSYSYIEQTSGHSNNQTATKSIECTSVLQVRTSAYLNMNMSVGAGAANGNNTINNANPNKNNQTKVLQKAKLRSVSVEADQTQKYGVCRDRKIVVPRLNLHVLPNYHGKSNKSLNQSLMDVYEKTRAK